MTQRWRKRHQWGVRKRNSSGRPVLSAAAAWLLLLGLLLAGVAQAAQPPLRLLVHGDSLSAAYGIPLERGWVALLQERLQQREPAWEVINSSISGETSAGGLARLPGLLQRQQPRAMLLALGANDGLRGLPPGQLQDNLRTMVQQAQAAGAEVLMVGVRLPPNYGQHYNEAFAISFDAVAQATGAALVESLLAPVENDRAAFLPDQLHPTAAVQPVLLDALWPQIEALLQRAEGAAEGSVAVPTG